MRRSMKAAVLLALLSSAAQAQTAPPPAPAAQREIFGDWALICTVPPGASAQSCELDATLQPEAQLPPVGKLAFVRGSADKPVRLVAIVQANLTLAPGVEVAANSAVKGVILGFKSCLNSACLADADLDADAVKVFRAMTKPGRLTINNAAGEVLSLAIPSRGIDQAIDALLAQPSQ